MAFSPAPRLLVLLGLSVPAALAVGVYAPDAWPWVPLAALALLAVAVLDAAFAPVGQGVALSVQPPPFLDLGRVCETPLGVTFKGYAPAVLGRLNRKGAPIIAIAVSGFFILVSAAMSMFTPKAYSEILGVALFGAMFVWIIVMLSHLGFRRRHRAEDLPVRTPFFPWLQISGVGIVGAVLITMGLDKDWQLAWIFGLPWLVLVSIAYFATKLVRRRAASAVPEPRT